MILAATRRGLAADKTPDDGEQHPNGSEGSVVYQGSSGILRSQVRFRWHLSSLFRFETFWQSKILSIGLRLIAHVKSQLGLAKRFGQLSAVYH